MGYEWRWKGREGQGRVMFVIIDVTTQCKQRNNKFQLFLLVKFRVIYMTSLKVLKWRMLSWKCCLLLMLLSQSIPCCTDYNVVKTIPRVLVTIIISLSVNYPQANRSHLIKSVPPKFAVLRGAEILQLIVLPASNATQHANLSYLPFKV